MSESGREIWARIDWPHGWEVSYTPQTGSTNDDLGRELAAGTAAHRTVLAAGHQTAGRGRMDRRWEAPPDANLLVSLAFTEVPDPPVELSHRVALALCSVVDGLLAGSRVVGKGSPCALKWPNDVLLDGDKLAGLLAARLSPSGAVVVGMGVNVGWAPPGAARLVDLDPGLHPALVLRDVLQAYDSLPVDVGPRYRSRLSTLGEHVRAHLPDGSHLDGRAIDVGADGRLAVLDECAVTHHLDAADVVHLRRP